MLRLTHEALVNLIGRPLALSTDVSMQGLGAFDRTLLHALLTPASIEEVACRLQLRQEIVARGLARLCDHFEVGDRLGLVAYGLGRRPKARPT